MQGAQGSDCDWEVTSLKLGRKKKVIKNTFRSFLTLEKTKKKKNHLETADSRALRR